MPVFNLNLLRKRQARTFSYKSCHFSTLQEAIKSDLQERIYEVKKDFNTALFIGKKPSDFPIKNTTFIDFYETNTQQFDLVFSDLNLHWSNDLPASLKAISSNLNNGGFFLASMLGSGTLDELNYSLHQASIQLGLKPTPRISPFPEMTVVGDLLFQSGIKLPLVDKDTYLLRYDNLRQLLLDIRVSGNSNALTEQSHAIPSKSFFSLAEKIYRDEFGAKDGTIPVSFTVLNLSGWKD